MIRFRRKDLVLIVRDYFDVLWDRAEVVLDAGVILPSSQQRLSEVEQALSGPQGVSAP